jgi:hypothetical protein
MATTTKIHVTATDNELYIIASTPAGTSEICHIKSGFHNPVEYVVIPQSILPPGPYTLIFVGINWSGPQQFTVILTTGGTDTTFTSGPPTTAPIGANWTKVVPINV